MREAPEAVEGKAVGTSEMVTPALAQIAWTAGASAVVGKSVYPYWPWRRIESSQAEENIPARSESEHLVGAHCMMDSVILSRPVEHWHLVSVSSQPAAGTAVAKQASYVGY